MKCHHCETQIEFSKLNPYLDEEYWECPNCKAEFTVEPYVKPYPFVPSGQEFVKLSKEEQEYWIRLVLSSSYATENILKMAYNENWQKEVSVCFLEKV